MTADRRKYTEEFKREAVRLMETSGKPIAELARDLGINDNNLYRWRGRMFCLRWSERQSRAGSLSYIKSYHLPKH